MISPIQKFHVVDGRLATGAQPGPEDFAWLRQQGFTTVVNLNLPSARNYLPNEASLVREQGLEYVDHPVDCSQLSPGVYDAFREALAGVSDGKVFIHCAANIKSTALVHAYCVKELGHDPASSLRKARQITDLEPKWLAWFARLGVPTSAQPPSVEAA